MPMFVFVWKSIDQATDRYHSSGGVVAFARTEREARLLAEAQGAHIADSEKPDLVVGCEECSCQAFIMPDAGCC